MSSSFEDEIYWNIQIGVRGGWHPMKLKSNFVYCWLLPPPVQFMVALSVSSSPNWLLHAACPVFSWTPVCMHNSDGGRGISAQFLYLLWRSRPIWHSHCCYSTLPQQQVLSRYFTEGRIFAPAGLWIRNMLTASAPYVFTFFSELM
jgi:hypothetical protein